MGYCKHCKQEVEHYINQDGVIYCEVCDSIIGEAEIKTKIGKIKFYEKHGKRKNKKVFIEL